MGAPAPIGYATLHLHGGDVTIDLCDLLCVDPYNRKWTVIKKGGTKYVIAKFKIEGKDKNVYMHHFLLGKSNGKVVDHIDRNGLNNRRNNLRWTDTHGNSANSGPRARGKSKYKGVCFHARTKRWRATIQARGKWRQLGLSAVEEDAARSYDAAAKKLLGDTAYLNSTDYPL